MLYDNSVSDVSGFLRINHVYCNAHMCVWRNLDVSGVSKQFHGELFIVKSLQRLEIKMCLI